MSIPSEFMCPISMDLMTDPVICGDGHTYERTAITEWLATRSISPLTRQPLTLAGVQPNYALRSAIERWKLANEAAPAPVELLGAPAEAKSFTVTAYTKDDKTVLDINTTHATAMETVLIAVLDVSGSMDTSANNNHQAEGDQFSRLDLVKHSMITLATLLEAEFATTQSSLALVSFSTAAKLIMPITKMDAVGLSTATTAIKSLKSAGSTNMWDGLRIGLIQAQAAIERNPNANIQILFLTDGEPSEDLLPPMGIKSTLKRKVDALKGKVTISTFGFGYNLSADLLESICIQGNGTYGFIPDCSMVGTVFINWAAKALLTLAHHITVELPSGQKYTVGDIIQGRSQTLVIPAITDAAVKITYDNGQELTVPIAAGAANHDAIMLDVLKTDVERLKKCARFDTIAPQIKSNLQSLKAAAAAGSTEFTADIARDIESDDESEGQIMKACSQRVWWESWGRNHCLSYFHALKLQQCVNFKDKVLQHFASDAFKALQEKGIDIFSSIAAPTPSVRNYASSSYSAGGYYGGAAAGGAYAPNPTVPISMATYVDNGGSCFTGDCKILMADTRLKRVEDLKKGDEVFGGHKVLAVLYTPVQKEVQMVKFAMGLHITPWHPMKLKDDGEWVFPEDVGVIRKVHVDAFYNLVLETGHIVELNGHQVVTLGHGFRDNDVITHPYFGTHAVIDDLKKHSDWEGGFLVMDGKNIVRSSETGLIQKI